MSQEANDEHITVSLKPEEVSYLQGVLREHVEYYGRFVQRLPSKCTPRNRQTYDLVSGLWNKLQTADNTLKLTKLNPDPSA
jgi:hypothetical protein